jgi:hypothetical protein
MRPGVRNRIIFYGGLVGMLIGAGVWMMAMPGTSHRGPLPPSDEAETKLAEALRKDVEGLVTGPRNTGHPATMPAAAATVSNAFTAAGYEVHHLPFEAMGQTVENLEVERKGTSKPDEIVIFGAHYDSANEAPGADDNASGVAALLALARRFAGQTTARTLRFVAFANEEPPHFWMETMGSLVYAKACKAKGDRVVAMLSLESVGYYASAAGSQAYPPIVRSFFPDTGDFIAVVGNLDSRSLTRATIRAFRGAVKFPSEGAALPSFIEGVGWSDQWAFWQVGYPGVMVTDTAPFRNPNYHQRSDLPATLDYARLARVVTGLEAVATALSQ